MDSKTQKVNISSNNSKENMRIYHTTLRLKANPLMGQNTELPSRYSSSSTIYREVPKQIGYSCKYELCLSLRETHTGQERAYLGLNDPGDRKTCENGSSNQGN